MAGNRQYMVGTNLPGCLPDTTDPLPLYDTEEGAIKALYDEVDKTVGDAVAEGKMQQSAADEALDLVKRTMITKLLALQDGDQFSLSVAGRVHFVHVVVTKAPTTDEVEIFVNEEDTDSVRNTTTRHLADLIRFTRTRFPRDAHSEVCAERNGLVFAILSVAGVPYEDEGQLRPTRAWQNMHASVRSILDGQVKDADEAAKWILDAAQTYSSPL